MMSKFFKEIHACKNLDTFSPVKVGSYRQSPNSIFKHMPFTQRQQEPNCFYVFLYFCPVTGQLQSVLIKSGLY